MSLLTGLGLLASASSASAADWKFWDFTTLADTQLTAPGEWRPNNANAPWTPSWDGVSSQIWTLGLPTSPTEEHREQFTPSPASSQPAISTYPYVIWKLTVSGVPANENIAFKPRAFLATAANVTTNTRSTKTWDLANGTYYLSLDQTDPANYDDNLTGTTFDPLTWKLERIRTQILVGTVSNYLTSYTGISYALDWVRVTDTPLADLTAPTGTVLVAGGNVTTSSTSVTVDLSAADNGGGIGLADYRLSNDNTTWSKWQPYAANVPWTLESGEGVKTVYVQFRDQNLNVSTATSDTIALDLAPPTATITLDDPNPTAADSVNFSVDFSEPLASPLTSGNISLSAGSLAGSITVTGTDPNYTVTVNPTNTSAAGTIGIDISGAGITDVLGAPYAGGSSPLYTILKGDWKFWDFTTLADTQLTAPGEWRANNAANAPWTPSWDGVSSQIWTLGLPVSPTEEHREQFTPSPASTQPAISAYPYVIWKLTVSGVPANENIAFKPRAFLATAANVTTNTRSTRTWDLANGTYYLSLDQTAPSNYDDNLTGTTFDPLTWKLERIRTQILVGTVSNYLTAYTGISYALDWVRVTDVPLSDLTAPTGTISVSGGNATTSSASVTVDLSAADNGGGIGLADYRLSNDNTTWSKWQPYAANVPWTLTAGDGIKTVFVQFRDQNLNVSTGNISDDITLASTPLSASITLDGATPTTANTVAFSIDFSASLASALPSGNVTLTAGSLAGSIALTGSNPNYTATVTLSNPDANGTVGIDVSGAGVVDGSSNPYAGGSSPLYTVYNWPGFSAEPQDSNTYSGESATFSVNASYGPITPTFQWKWDNGAKTIQNGPTTPSWTITNASSANNGSYYVEVTYDGVTYTTAPATLLVQDHLQLTTPLANAARLTGQAITYNADTTGGFTPLSYIWKKDNVIIPDATGSSYTLTNLELADAATYSVEVSDAESDSVTSSSVLSITEASLPAAGTPGLIALALLMAGIYLFLQGRARVEQMVENTHQRKHKENADE